MKWAISIIAVAAAMAFALWPRPEMDRSSPGVASGQVSGWVPPANSLAPCPQPLPVTGIASLADVSVTCLSDGRGYELGAALAGRTVVLNLWASWCAPCREEMPILSAYANEPGAALVVGLNVQDIPESAYALIAELEVTYPSYFDDKSLAQEALAAPPVLPVTYIVSPDRSISRVRSPLVFRTVEQVRTAIRNAISA